MDEDRYIDRVSIGELLNKEYPRKNKEKPGEGEEKPRESKKKPGEGKEKPREDEEKPREDEEKPREDEKKPREDEEKPREGEEDNHIQHFYFQVEVTARNERGDPLEGDVLESTDLNLLFPEHLFEWSRIVEDFGTVKKEDVFKITYIAKYRSCGPPGTARQVEAQLGDIHITIRERFKKEVKDTSNGRDVDVFVLLSRCCNYYNYGVN